MLKTPYHLSTALYIHAYTHAYTHIMAPYLNRSGRREFMSISLLKTLTLTLLLSFLVACGNEPPPEQIRSTAEWTLPVTTVKEEILPDQYLVIGTVTADQTIDVSSKMIGYIKDLKVNEGD